VLGGAEGAELMATAEATLRTLGVLDPRLDAAYNFPELMDGES
jgi:hypothetical protein